jgi:hypothetical protein
LNRDRLVPFLKQQFQRGGRDQVPGALGTAILFVLFHYTASPSHTNVVVCALLNKFFLLHLDGKGLSPV